MNRNRRILWLDIGLFLAVCALESKILTGVPAHEWLGALFALTIVIHLLLQWSWVELQFRRLFTRGALRARFNYFLNTAIFLCTIAAIVSGFMISEYVLPISGRQLNDSFAWHTIHGNTGHAIMFLAGLHLALNWDWVVATVRGRLKARPALEGPGLAVPSARRLVTFRNIRRLGVLILVSGVVAVGTYGFKRALIEGEFVDNDAYAVTRRATVSGALPLPTEPESANRPARREDLQPDTLRRGRLLLDARHPSFRHGYPAFVATVVIIGLMTVVGRKVLRIRL